MNENGHKSRRCEIDVIKSIVIYFVCLGSLWIVGILCVELQTRVFHRNTYPFNTLLFIPKVQFTDFTIFYPKLRVFGNPDAFFSSSGSPFTYPAPLLLIAVGLWRLSHYPLGVYLCCVLIFAAAAGITAFRAVWSRGRLFGLAALVALAGIAASFPLYFLLDRANLEGFVWMATALGLYGFARKRYLMAAAFLALAASMKIFPGVLLLLFLAKRRYRDFFLSAGFTAIFTLFSLWVTGPSILDAAHGLAKGIDHVRNAEVMTFVPTEIGFDHSLFTFVKWFALFSTSDIPSYGNLIRKILPIYSFCALTVFVAFYFVKLRRMPVLNQVIALTAVAIVLPFSSFEYTLVHLGVPYVFLLIFLVTDVASGAVPLNRNDVLKMVLPFALLFGPLSFLIFIIAGVGAQIKAVALIYLITMCSRVPMRSSLFEEVDGVGSKPSRIKESAFGEAQSAEILQQASV